MPSKSTMCVFINLHSSSILEALEMGKDGVRIILTCGNFKMKSAPTFWNFAHCTSSRSKDLLEALAIIVLWPNDRLVLLKIFLLRGSPRPM